MLFEFDFIWEIIPFGGYAQNSECQEPESGKGKSDEKEKSEKSDKDGKSDKGEGDEKGTGKGQGEPTDEEGDEMCDCPGLDIYVDDSIEDEEDDEQEASGGGALLKIKKTPELVKITEIMERLANGKSMRWKRSGQESINPKVMLKYLIGYSPIKAINSKRDRKPKKVYFFVDTSGSVQYLAALIINLINATAKSKYIRVLSGAESHPNYDENDGSKALPYSAGNNNSTSMYSRREEYLDQTMKKFIKLEQPDIGSNFVFWGDLEGCGIRPDVLKDVLRNYNCIWLNPSNKDKERYNENIKTRIVMPVHNSINSEFKFVHQLKCII